MSGVTTRVDTDTTHPTVSRRRGMITGILVVAALWTLLHAYWPETRCTCGHGSESAPFNWRSWAARWPSCCLVCGAPWGPPLRLGAPAEVTLIQLTRA